MQTYGYPLDIQLKFENKRVCVAFGERDGVCIGHVLLAVNGQPLTYKDLPDGKDVFEVNALSSVAKTFLIPIYFPGVDNESAFNMNPPFFGPDVLSLVKCKAKTQFLPHVF